MIGILVFLFWFFIGVPAIITLIANGGVFTTVLMVGFFVFLYQVLGVWSIPVIIFVYLVWYSDNC